MAKRRKKPGRRAGTPRRSPARISSNKPAPRRRRKSRNGLLSAGSGMSQILMQGGLALAGGLAGKVVRNAIPENVNAEIKAAVTAAGGIALIMFAKQPAMGFGMVGSAGAYYASVLGMNLGIPLLSEENPRGSFLAEGNTPNATYFDSEGRKLIQKGNSFYYENGVLSQFSQSDFQYFQK